MNSSPKMMSSTISRYRSSSDAATGSASRRGPPTAPVRRAAQPVRQAQPGGPTVILTQVPERLAPGPEAQRALRAVHGPHAPRPPGESGPPATTLAAAAPRRQGQRSRDLRAPGGPQGGQRARSGPAQVLVAGRCAARRGTAAMLSPCSSRSRSPPRGRSRPSPHPGGHLGPAGRAAGSPSCWSPTCVGDAAGFRAVPDHQLGAGPTSVRSGCRPRPDRVRSGSTGRAPGRSGRRRSQGRPKPASSIRSRRPLPSCPGRRRARSGWTASGRRRGHRRRRRTAGEDSGIRCDRARPDRQLAAGHTAAAPSRPSVGSARW
jgi:hypothetical protein